jgi:hypothetical protein
MQMHKANIVEDAAWAAGAVAVRFIAVRVRDHRFRTNLPSARPSRFPAAGFTILPPHACEFLDGFIDWSYGGKSRVSSSSTKAPI